MSIDRKMLAAALAATVLCGCAVDPQTGMMVAQPYQLGEASKQTLMAQVIDPDPVYDRHVPVSSGDHAQDAIDRYNNDAVKEPETIRSTSATGSGSGGGSN